MKFEIIYNIPVQVLEKLEKECFPNSFYNLEQLEDIVREKERYRTISIKFQNEYVGYIILFDNSETLEIMKIGTLCQHRKKGIGELLLKESLKEKKDIFLEVRESNLTARNFYLKNGFMEVGKRKNYYPDTKEAAIIMLKSF